MERNNYELPVLNSYLLKNIIFSMENQGAIGYLDLESGEVVEISNINDPVVVRENKKSEGLISITIKQNKDRFLALPPWGSIEGFKIREQFIKDMKNPVYKKTLNHVFHTGRGVFRKFKEVLKENPIIERQWIEYKSNYMRAIVVNWYKECEGYINLLNLEEEVEELPNDLLISDFIFSTKISETDYNKLRLLKNDTINDLTFFEKTIVKRRQDILNKPNYIVSYNLSDEIAAFIEWEEIEKDTIEITSYGVEKQYRGLGLFNIMLDKVIRQASRQSYDKVVIYISQMLVKFENNSKKDLYNCNFGYSIIDVNYWNMDVNSSELLDV